MARLAFETRAIIGSTLPQVQARRPDITMCMWHHLPPDFNHDMLFVSHDRTGGGHPLIEALLDTLPRLQNGEIGSPVPIGLTEDQCARCDVLRQAFVHALADALDGYATDMVLNAWQQLLDAFFAENCQYWELPVAR